jgi:hypothetical protein
MWGTRHVKDQSIAHIELPARQDIFLK